MYSSKSLIWLLLVFSLLYVVHILNKIQQNIQPLNWEFNYHLQISLWKYEYIRRN